MEGMMQGCDKQDNEADGYKEAAGSSNALMALSKKAATGAANVFGSDIYLRIGTMQFWDSNQVAHAMLGFTGTSLTSLVFFRYFGKEYLCAGLLFMIFPIWRDVIDYCVDSKVFDEKFSAPFLHKGEVLRDCLTDTSFWLCGSLLAITAILAGVGGTHASSHAFGWFIIATALTMWHGISQYKPQKMRFDRSGIPYFVRLAKLKAEFCSQDAPGQTSEAEKCKARDTIRDFLDPDKPFPVMIIAGDDDSGKTTLACGVATEFAVWPKHPFAPNTRYILMGELYSMVRRERGRYGSSGVVSDTRPISAAVAEVLFIDEAELTPDHLERLDKEIAENAVANRGEPAPDHPISIADGLKFLLLGKKRVALVIHSTRVDLWKDWLRTQLHTEDDIPTIWIKKIVDDKSVQPTRWAKILSVGLFGALLLAVISWLCALLYTPLAQSH
jgi:hypothetical protein